ncbi:ArsR/SmtB family transcription factor [Streptacidiphilus jiangxiensis]|uniref:Helix-turn-helix domain-containing protein n=1 Tax=Streptacidiphilus jiangxiensis TaxID=235985 RepID=A0A1H7QY83_STRJI|nr:metalloregulator ArsR/SmtB family transcription factor [Streptacidiphilus jiangxiensis]SEL52970.1 Helix-turn-helix domain-containing protein [Streptacidiphilus jiangxiensis]
MSLESGPATPADPAGSAVALRALAHPHRLAIRELLTRQGPLSAAEAARELGISQALASHHLRLMAKYGLVLPAAARDQRERRWRLANAELSLGGGEKQGVEVEQATQALERLYLERALTRFTRWQEQRESSPRAWQDQAGLSDSLLRMTVDELAEFNRAVQALLTPFVQRAAEPGRQPANAQPVAITILVTPGS